MRLVAAVPVDPSQWPPGVEYRPPAGYSQHPCSGCGQPLWVGPKILARAAGGVPVWCPRCLRESGALDGGYKVSIIPE